VSDYVDGPDDEPEEPGTNSDADSEPTTPLPPELASAEAEPSNGHDVREGVLP